MWRPTWLRNAAFMRQRRILSCARECIAATGYGRFRRNQPRTSRRSQSRFRRINITFRNPLEIAVSLSAEFGCRRKAAGVLQQRCAGFDPALEFAVPVGKGEARASSVAICRKVLPGVLVHECGKVTVVNGVFAFVRKDNRLGWVRSVDLGRFLVCWS